jgi:PEP-CTERM motif
LPVFHLSQTGTIPRDATGLQFLLFNSGGAPFGMSINGNPVSYAGDGIEVANVSAYAGQTVNLEFTFQPYGGMFFDIAGFTTTPEPPTYALFGVGAAALLWFHRRKP